MERGRYCTVGTFYCGRYDCLHEKNKGFEFYNVDVQQFRIIEVIVPCSWF